MAAQGAAEGVGIPVAAAVFGAAGLVFAAAAFFLSSSPPLTTVLAAAALAGAGGGGLFGACGVRRPLGELGVVGLVAGGMSLPLGAFDVLLAVSGTLG
ncbi:MAG: hypothetical protein J2P43_03020 [Candidatus Dormibacteraeota bacterium]|nr:hypothetical protein [Candidatus Dormibacteraeota bacterium]